MVNNAQSSQKDIEAKMARISAEPIVPGASGQDVFGLLEHWFLTLGEYRFFLNPMTASWMFYDPVHQCWVKTDHQAGDGSFVLDDQGELSFIEAEEKVRISPVPVPSWQKNPAYQPFFDLEARYLLRLESFYYDEIGEEDFLEAVYQLRLQDAQGIWWQMRPADGGWYRWEGTQWIEDVPYRSE